MPVNSYAPLVKFKGQMYIHHCSVDQDAKCPSEEVTSGNAVA